ncbi:rab-like protein 3 [Salarias fasciatus]|uniref:rab-like protein 3 n=1 Tax=Salarias fasciatus TaxID=181472 RepID=UPI0011769911|nr:rab-like protein 3 [Salarias fasciatus]
MASLDRVKVLVLGDSGVGKSSLVHLLCQNQVLGNPSWTVGCSADVRVQDYKEGTPDEKTFYIELWDVGGSAGSASSVKSTRAVFYNSVNGIILVHYLTNKKSSQNLYRWSLEAMNRDSSPTGDCTNPRYLAAGTSNAVKLSKFFNKVIKKRYFTRDPSQMTGFTDSKRFNFKSLHYD